MFLWEFGRGSKYIFTYTVTEIAKELGMSARKLNGILKDNHIQFKHRDKWVLYSAYQDQGYTDTYTHVITDNMTTTHTVWTEKGRQFIHGLINQKIQRHES